MLLFLYAMLLELSYVCILSLLIYLDILPEAICCYTVNNVLLVMYCMCLPAFFVTSADKSQIWVIFMLFNCLRLFVVV